MRITLATLLLTCLCVSNVEAQMVRNPNIVEIGVSIDHDTLDGYECDIISQSDGQIIATLDLGMLPDSDGDGLVEFQIKVQPIRFGTYMGECRGYVSGVLSDNTADPDPWENSCLRRQTIDAGRSFSKAFLNIHFSTFLSFSGFTLCSGGIDRA